MPQTLASASGQPGCGLWYYSQLSYAQTMLPILRILPVGGVLVSPAGQPKVAGLPADRLDSDPDEPAAATETPNVSIPVEIGEPSATELPVAPKETTSATEKPEQAKPQREIRRRAHRPRRARTASGATSQRPFNLFEVLFGGQQYRYQPPAYSAQSAQGQYQQPTYGTQQPAQGQYQQPAYGNQQATPQTPVEPYPMSRQHIY